MNLLPSRLRPNLPLLILWFFIFTGLYFIAQWNYLFFHVLVELFSIIIALTIFVLSWNTRRFADNGYLLFTGIAFLFVAAFDVLHTLTYRGMNIFPGASTDIPTQLWLSERLITALALFLAPFFLKTRPTTRFIAASVVGFGVLSLVLLLSITVWRILPVTFNEATGLTPFKVYTEYFIIALFLAGGVFLFQVRGAFNRGVLLLLIGSIALNMAAEYLFTTYLTVTDARNLVGHFFKVAAYYLIYKAIIETGLLRPYDLLFHELSEREQALRESQALERNRLRQIEAIIDAVPAIVRITDDPEGCTVYGNRMAYEFLRVPPGTNLSAVSPDAPSLLHYKAFQDGRELKPEEFPLHITAVTGQPLREIEETIVFEDGSSYRLYGNVSPLHDLDGRVSGAVAALLDITGLVKTEEALAESEQRYRGLFERMVEGFILLEALPGEQAGLRVLEVNPAFERISGRPREACVGKTVQDLVGDLSAEWIDELLRVATQGESARFEGYLPQFNKTLEVTAFQAREGQCAALVTDISERVKAREDLRHSEARLRRLVDSNIIGIIFSNENGAVDSANDAFLQMLGYTRREFETGHLDWVRLTPSEFLARDLQGIAEAKERGACTPYEKEYIHKNGSRVPVLIGFAYYAESSPQFICFILDLTARKLAEARLESYALQLEQSNRELQDFAFVASHDLQEPLRKIQAFGERLQERLKDNITPDELDYLNRMLSASNRMRVMINDLLSLSRITTRAQPFAQVDLNETVREVLSDLEVRILSSRGTVEVGALPTIEADPLQMHQLFQNLIGNGLKFHKDDTNPVVSVVEELSGQSNRVTITVQDNGIGFEQEYADRIFQPFQRLHGVGRYEGSGIGLAICRKIVERHSGTITARSQPGEGAAFTITLPIKQRKKTG